MGHCRISEYVLKIKLLKTLWLVKCDQQDWHRTTFSEHEHPFSPNILLNKTVVQQSRTSVRRSWIPQRARRTPFRSTEHLNKTPNTEQCSAKAERRSWPVLVLGHPSGGWHSERKFGRPKTFLDVQKNCWAALSLLPSLDADGGEGHSWQIETMVRSWTPIRLVAF